MPEPATQVRADDEPVSLHFTQLLSEHLFRRLREHPAELAQSHGSSSEIGDNSDFPSPVNQRDSELNGLVFFAWALTIKNSYFFLLSIRIPIPNGHGLAYSVRHNPVALLA